MNEVESEFPYRPKWSVIVWVTLFFGVGAAVIGHAASVQDTSLPIFRVLGLSPSHAGAVLWVMFGLCTGFVAVGLFLAVFRLLVSQRIALTANSVILPASRWTSRESAVEYSKITSLRFMEVRGQRFIKVSYQGGSFTITESQMPSESDFNMVVSVIEQRSGAPRT